LEEIIAAPGLENRSYDRRESLQKLALTSSTGGGRSMGKAHHRTVSHGAIFFIYPSMAGSIILSLDLGRFSVSSSHTQ
jgi:hypothetical protein